MRKLIRSFGVSAQMVTSLYSNYMLLSIISRLNLFMFKMFGN